MLSVMGSTLMNYLVLLPFVSMLDGKLFSTTSVDSDYVYIQSNKSSYKYHAEELSWSDAVSACSSEGAQLFYPEDVGEARLVAETLNVFNEYNYIWLGIMLHVDLDVIKRYKTVDGRSIINVYHDWERGQPNSGYNDACRWVTLKKTYKLYVVCDHWRNRFICKRSEENQGPGKPTSLECDDAIPITAAPFMALFHNDEYTCGAAIVHSKVVLSAAHCNKKSGHPRVYVGTDTFVLNFKAMGGIYAAVKEVVSSPQYKGNAASFENDLKYDVCFIYLKTMLSFNAKVKPIPLGYRLWGTRLIPKKGESMQLYEFTGMERKIFVKEIRAVKLQYVTESICQDVFGNNPPVINDSVICAKSKEGRGGCPGDSHGGLLVYKGHLLGILSSIANASCTGQPSVIYFSNVPALETAVQNTIAANRETHCKFQVTDGRLVPITEAPFVASFKLEDKRFTCAATIIHEQFLLSNAHCLRNTALMQAQVVINVGHESNDGGGEKYIVDKIFIHPKFDENTYDYDLAVIKLRKKITWTGKIRKIGIRSTYPGPKRYPQRNTGLDVYGFTNKDGVARLHNIYLPYQDFKYCKSFFSEKFLFGITDRHICAGTRLSGCAGDSSAPLVYKNFLVGIASWGRASCSWRYPSVFTNVPLLKPYIDEIIRKNK